MTPAPAVVLPLALSGCAVLLIAGGAAGAAAGLGWLVLGALGYGARAARTEARAGEGLLRWDRACTTGGLADAG